MKISLIGGSTEPESFKRLVRELRSRLGTCEHLRLPHDISLPAQRNLLEAHFASMSFDRHILYYEAAEHLLPRLSMIAGVNQLTLLSLQLENDAHRKAVRDFARAFPWVRWAGSDRRSLAAYQQEGFDAHLLPPLVSVPSMQEHAQDIVADAVCHVLGEQQSEGSLVLPPAKAQFYRYPSPDEGLLDYIQAHVRYGDIIFIQEKPLIERHLLALAMSLGAVVIVPSSMIEGEHSRYLLRSACVRVDTAEEIAVLFDHIGGSTFKELVKRSLNHTVFFSPEAIARDLARILTQPGRDRDTYYNISAWL